MDAASLPVGPGRPSLMPSPADAPAAPPARHSLLDQLACSDPAERGMPPGSTGRPRAEFRGGLAGLWVAAVGVAAVLSGILTSPWSEAPRPSEAPATRAGIHLPAPAAASPPAAALTAQAARIEEVSSTPAVSPGRSASASASGPVPARGEPSRSARAAAGESARPPRGHPRPAPATARAAPRDPDVEVVAALIGQGPGTATLPAPPPAVSHSSLAGLAATCRGSDQAALICRHRICRGYWGRADACPAGEEAAAARAAQRGPL